jgi:hypothetical protein
VLPLDRDCFKVLGALRATAAARLEARAGALQTKGGIIGRKTLKFAAVQAIA